MNNVSNENHYDCDSPKRCIGSTFYLLEVRLSFSRFMCFTTAVLCIIIVSSVVVIRNSNFNQVRMNVWTFI